MDELAGGIVILPGEARTISESGFNVQVLASAHLTDGAFTLIATVEQDAGIGPPLHVHRDCAESFYVVSGLYSMHINGADFECPAGSFVYVPRDTAHTFRVQQAGSRKLNLYTPAAMEGYFDELSDALKAGVDEARLAEIAERYNMTVLGPPPDSYLDRPD